MFRSVRFTASRWGRVASSCAAAIAALVAATPSLATSSGSGPGSGGAAIGKAPTPSGGSVKGRWLSGFTVTEYWPTPESWFEGKLVDAPGLSGRHRIDWLYSARGVSMEGDGIGLDGRMYHIDSMGAGGWVTAAGKPTAASNEFAAGPPFWRAGAYWRNRSGGVTFPLSAGGWYSGPGGRYVPLGGVTFAPGPSLPLHFYQSIAVDPHVIPLGSRVYIPAYQHDGHGGWFIAQDTGGAINGRRIDVYRPPPSSPNIGGQDLPSQRVLVVKPSH